MASKVALVGESAREMHYKKKERYLDQHRDSVHDSFHRKAKNQVIHSVECS